VTTCERTLGLLDDYVDGQIDEADFQEVELHLRDCAACRGEEQHLRALLARLAALPGELEPARDLWPGIAARLNTRRASSFLPGMGHLRTWVLPVLATAAVLAVATNLWRERPAAVRPTPGVSAQSAAFSSDPGLRAAQDDYARAANDLMKVLATRRDALPPETVQSVEANLHTIDEALGQIRVALQQDPDNPQLARLLTTTHRRKVAFLQQVVKLSTRL
jgi:predicted anti-sigma-YlaC factor YlaD